MNLTCAETIDCKQGSIRAVRYNVDGNYCITCGSDRKLKLWNPSRNLLLKTYAGHADEVLDSCGSCESSHIVSSSADKSVILWDVMTGRPLRRFRGHASSVTCVKFNEESTVAISGSRDNSIMCWDIRSRNNASFQTIKDAKDCVTSLQITDHEIIASSLDGKVRLYDIRMGQMISDCLGYPITCISATRDGQCILASCSNETILLIDKDSGELLGEYAGHKTNDYSIESTIAQNDNHILSGSSNSLIYVWDLVSGNLVHQLKPPQAGVVHSLCAHPSKEELLSASGNFIHLWIQNTES